MQEESMYSRSGFRISNDTNVNDIKPLKRLILVEMIEDAKMNESTSGIIFVSTVEQGSSYHNANFTYKAKVVSLGPDVKQDINVGDIVYLPSRTGSKLFADKKREDSELDYRMIHELDIIGFEE